MYLKAACVYAWIMSDVRGVTRAGHSVCVSVSSLVVVGMHAMSINSIFSRPIHSGACVCGSAGSMMAGGA